MACLSANLKFVMKTAIYLRNTVRQLTFEDTNFKGFCGFYITSKNFILEIAR